ncbi:MAG: alpha/beta fold hydrolase [Actinomycetota bacterium]
MRARRLDMPWGRLRLWEAGEGPTTILAVHGLGGSGRYWDGLAEAVGPGFRVIAPDLGGFGGSSEPREAADRAFHLEALDAVARSAG